MSIYLWPEGAPLAEGKTEEDRPRLTAYIVPKGTLTSAVIICPGGGYARRAEHEGKPAALWLNGLGISAFVLDYRVAPYKHPVPLLDAQRAIRHVRHHAQEWNIDPNRIGILGFSAGGHLASAAGTLFDSGNPHALDPIDQVSSRPDAMVLCYPVISFGNYLHQGSMNNLLGNDAPAEQRSLFSSEMRVTSETPPTFLWHTVDDAAVPVQNSLLFAAALSQHKISYDLHCYESGKHGLGMAKDHPQAHSWTQLCELWLGKRGFLHS
jgi:acetyl esterase/lipase